MTSVQQTTNDSTFASQCLGEFLTRVLKVDPHPAVLDLGVLCGANIAFLGEKGCRVSVESLPSGPIRKDGASAEALSLGPGGAKLPTSPLKYPPGSFSGVLAWDAIARMPLQQATPFAEILRSLLLDGGVILAHFPGAAGRPGAPAGRYRILGDDRLKLEPTDMRLLASSQPPYQNREIYMLFSRFEIVRLSQLKSGTREVLVARPRLSGRS
ncbi:MAG TPA: hypothetical protein VGK94_03915 [Candidatus Polarisedimenticolia bacterium]